MNNTKTNIIVFIMISLLTTTKRQPNTDANTDATFVCNVNYKTYSFNITAPKEYQKIKNKSMKLFSKSKNDSLWIKFDNCIQLHSWISCVTNWKTDDWNIPSVKFMLQVYTSTSVHKKYQNITTMYSTAEERKIMQWLPIENGFYCYHEHGIDDFDMYETNRNCNSMVTI